MSSSSIVPEDLSTLLKNLKRGVDIAEDWNGAIRDAMQDPSLLELISKYDVKKHDLRCFLAGRYDLSKIMHVRQSS